MAYALESGADQLVDTLMKAANAVGKTVEIRLQLVPDKKVSLNCIFTMKGSCSPINTGARAIKTIANWISMRL